MSDAPPQQGRWFFRATLFDFPQVEEGHYRFQCVFDPGSFYPDFNRTIVAMGVDSVALGTLSMKSWRFPSPRAPGWTRCLLSLEPIDFDPEKLAQVAYLESPPD